MYQQWKERGVKFIGVGLLDKKEACQAFVRRHRLTFPNVYDPDTKVAKSYGFTYQPYWAAIAGDGRLLQAGYGPANEGALISTIKALVGR